MGDKYEKAARALGWTRGGDFDGIIYNVNHYDSWKAAVSWAPDNGSIYDSWEDCCEMEGIETEPLTEDEIRREAARMRALFFSGEGEDS